MMKQSRIKAHTHWEQANVIIHMLLVDSQQTE